MSSLRISAGVEADQSNNQRTKNKLEVVLVSHNIRVCSREALCSTITSVCDEYQSNTNLAPLFLLQETDKIDGSRLPMIEGYNWITHQNNSCSTLLAPSNFPLTVSEVKCECKWASTYQIGSNLIVMSIYRLATKTDNSNFWNPLKKDIRLLNQLSKPLIIVGDFNARCGQEVGDSHLDTNGKQLLKLIEDCNLNMLNNYGEMTRMQCNERSYHKVSRSIIDYMLINQQARQLIKGPLNYLPVVHSDHVIMYQRMSLEPDQHQLQSEANPNEDTNQSDDDDGDEPVEVLKERNKQAFIFLRQMEKKLSSMVRSSRIKFDLDDPIKRNEFDRQLFKLYFVEGVVIPPARNSALNEFTHVNDNAADVQSWIDDQPNQQQTHQQVDDDQSQSEQQVPNWEEFVSKTRNIAEQVFGVTQPSNNYKAWWNDQCSQVVREQRHFYQTNKLQINRGDRQVWNEYKVLRKRSKETIRLIRFNHYKSLNEKVKRLLKVGKSREFWFRTVGGRVKQQIPIEMTIKVNQDNEIIQPAHKALEQVFKSKSSKPPDLTPDQQSVEVEIIRPMLKQWPMMDSCDEPITEDEVRQVIKQKASKKSAPGIDGITYEFLNILGEWGIIVLTKIFNEILDKLNDQHHQQVDAIPLSWFEGLIMPLFKSGDKKNASNYRPITLLSAGRKILEAILIKRVSDQIEKDQRLHKCQAGFRRNRSTIMNALVINETILRHKDVYTKSPSIVTAYDVIGAYDCVDRDRLWYKCKKIGMSDKLINFFACLNNQLRLRVKVNDQLSEGYGLEVGLTQGSACSPDLYNIFMMDLGMYVDINIDHAKVDMFNRESYFKPTRSSSKAISILLWADDIITFTLSIESNKLLASVIEQHSIDNNYRISLPKTECIVDNIDTNDLNQIQIYKQPIKQVKLMRYLGIYFDKNGINSFETIKRRNLAAMNSAKRLIWRGCWSDTMDVDISMLLIKQVILPSSDYGLAIIDPEQANRTGDGTVRMLIRRSLQLSPTTNSNYVYWLSNIEPMFIRALRANIKLYDKLTRNRANDIPHELVADLVKYPHTKHLKSFYKHRIFFHRTEMYLKELLKDWQVGDKLPDEMAMSKIIDKYYEVKYQAALQEPSHRFLLNAKPIPGLDWIRYERLDRMDWRMLIKAMCNQINKKGISQHRCLLCLNGLEVENSCELITHWLWKCEFDRLANQASMIETRMEVKQLVSNHRQSMMKVRKDPIKQIDMNQIDLEGMIKEQEQEEDMVEASWDEIENSLELTSQLIGFGSIKKAKAKKKMKVTGKSTKTKKKKKVNMEVNDKDCWKVMAKLNGFLRLICKSNMKMSEPQTPPLEVEDQELGVELEEQEGRLQVIETETESTQEIDSMER